MWPRGPTIRRNNRPRSTSILSTSIDSIVCIVQCFSPTQALGGMIFSKNDPWFVIECFQSQHFHPFACTTPKAACRWQMIHRRAGVESPGTRLPESNPFKAQGNKATHTNISNFNSHYFGVENSTLACILSEKHLSALLLRPTLRNISISSQILLRYHLVHNRACFNQRLSGRFWKVGNVVEFTDAFGFFLFYWRVTVRRKEE